MLAEATAELCPFSQFINMRLELASRQTATAHSVNNLPDLWNQALGGDPADAKPAASAWRMMYASLSLLDDLEDGDFCPQKWQMEELVPTGSARFAPIALNVTTGLIAQTALVLESLNETSLDSAATAAIRHAFYQTLLSMTKGQHADLAFGQPSLEKAWEIAVAKSGLWFRLGCWAGARTATADPDLLEQTAIFGENLGLQIQLGDDLGDMWAKDGKQSDLMQGSCWSLPVAYAITVLPEPKRSELQLLLELVDSEPEAEGKARAIIIESGAPLFLSVKAKSCRAQAEAALERIGGPAGPLEPFYQMLEENDLVK